MTRFLDLEEPLPEPVIPWKPRKPLDQRRSRRADYEAQHEKQGGLCAVCGRPEPVAGRRLAADHDHATNAERELLCSPCNLALGLMDDDPARAEALAAYLRRHGR